MIHAEKAVYGGSARRSCQDRSFLFRQEFSQGGYISINPVKFATR